MELHCSELESEPSRANPSRTHLDWRPSNRQTDPEHKHDKRDEGDGKYLLSEDGLEVPLGTEPSLLWPRAHS